ncbi:MAG: molybdenum cofactor guanylyltransferase [Halolamina sp.]
MPSAVVIAGGRSTRFGDADKALAELAGTPMTRRVADRLASPTDELVVNCRPAQRPALAAALEGYDNPVRFAVDDEPDRGPVAGIRNGLAAAHEPTAVVVACDMPFVDPEFVATLLDRVDDRDAAVPRPAEWYEPTQAAYRCEPMVAACESALAEGQPRILDPLEELDWTVVGDVPDEETFRNVNTPEELAAAEADLRGE